MTNFSSFKSQLVSASTSAAGIELGGGGVTEYASTLEMPTTGIETGEMAYATSTNKLYMWNGNAWFNIAMVNQAPTGITGGSPSYQLAIDGTPTVVTLISTDPEGFPLTWSAATSGDTAVGTLTQADNVFTITPSTDEADVGTLSVTFSVTDGTNTETATSVFTLAFLSPLWNETVLSIGTSSTDGLANSTFIDRSTNAHTVTPTGSPAQTAFHPYLDNWSVEFNGSDQGVYLGTTALDNLSSTFSMEAWIYPRSISTGSPDYWNNGIIAKGNTYLNFGISNDGRVQLYYFDGAVQYRYSTGTVNINEWTHVGVTVTGGTITFYINGVASGTGTWNGMQSGHVGTDCYVGTTSDGNAGSHRWFDGWIADARVVDGSVVVPDPSTKATAVTNTLFLVNTSNRLQDLSGNYTPTPYGDPKVSAFNPFGQESEYAVGENRGSVLFKSGDTLTRATTGFYTVSSFCIEFWIYPLSNQSHYICEGTQQGSGTWRLTIDSSSGGIGFSYAAGSWAGVNFGSGTGRFNSHEWTHIAISKTSSGVFRIFINGVEVGTQTSTSSLINTGRNFQFGYYVDGSGTSYSNALFSDFKITRQDPVYTSNFTVPTSPVGGTNLSTNDPYMYFPFDNAGVFDKTGLNTLTPVGNVSTSTTQTKFADTAMYFDGNDYITLKQSDSLILSPNDDFTIEAWVYLNSLSTTMQMLCMFAPPHHSIALSLNRSGTGNTWLLYGNGSSWTGVPTLNASSNPLSAGVWQHIALVKNGSTSTVYHNGLASGSTTTTFTTTTGNLVLGAYELNGGYGEYLNGYIENFQVLKGVAKYTTNFTPPNRTQGITYQAES